MTAPERPAPSGADPDAVARAVGGDVQRRETHISHLFLTGDRAYKLKKPLVLDFLDYGTPELRLQACRDEVRLNRRLAPELYLGVRGLVPAAGAVKLADAEDPQAIDYLVQMRRYDEEQTLAAAVGRGEPGADQLRRLGTTLAAFHADCPPAAGAPGAVRALAMVERNLKELGARLVEADDIGRVLTLGRFLRAFVRARAALFDRRAAEGRVREVHGDLRAEHVILRPRLSVVDCVEFDAGLRTLEVADDLGFLAMDLCALGAEPAAREVVAGYRAAGGDCGPDELLWFHAVHRALVRAKVAFVRARQEEDDAAAGSRAEAGRLLGLAESLSWRARGPLALVLCGVPASGKSYLAKALADAFALPRLSSDVVRKELAGLGPHERAPETAYATDVSAGTYQALAERAADGVAQHGCVLLDATFRHRADRERLRRALEPGIPVVFAECLAPAAVLAERADLRDRDPDRVSDATADIARRLRAEWEPLDEVPAAAHLALRTDRPVSGVISDLAALLDERL